MSDTELTLLTICGMIVLISAFLTSTPADREHWTFIKPLKILGKIINPELHEKNGGLLSHIYDLFNSSRDRNPVKKTKSVLIALLLLETGGVVSGIIHILLALIIFDVVRRRAPLSLLLLPSMYYGGYTLAYQSEQKQIAVVRAELAANKPHPIITFDFSSDSLVIPATSGRIEDAESFLQTHEIPVVYEEHDYSKPKYYLSYRMLPRSQCDNLKVSLPRDMDVHRVWDNSRNRIACILMSREDPTGNIVRVTTSHPPSMNAFVKFRDVTIVVDNKVLGSFRAADFYPLPKFPVFVIYISIDQLEWGRLKAHFIRDHFKFDPMTNNVDRNLYDTPLALMLGIKKYAPGALANFTGFEQNANVLTKIRAAGIKNEEEDFNRLETILAGGRDHGSYNLGAFLVRKPARLAPYGERMAQRLTELESAAMTDPKNKVKRRDQRATPLAVALSSLSPEIFAAVAARIFALAQHADFLEDYPALYLRAADAGPQTLDFYKSEFLEGHFANSEYENLPTLALCRIGVVDMQVVEEMKRRYLAPDKDIWRPEANKAALFLALLKFGQESFLRANEASAPAQNKSWRKALVARDGWTETGPNNCMIDDWPHSLRPAILAPRLNEFTGREIAPH